MRWNTESGILREDSSGASRPPNEDTAREKKVHTQYEKIRREEAKKTSCRGQMCKAAKRIAVLEREKSKIETRNCTHNWKLKWPKVCADVKPKSAEKAKDA
jgi:hypothetical protein